MKHVTLFSQLAEYQTFMGGGDSLKPNVSYVREDGKVYATGDVSEDFSGAVVYARYNITDDMSKTGLFNMSNVKALKVDGEVMEFEPEVEMSGELTVLGENISFDMENETYTVPDEYLFDNTKLSSLVVRPANGDISAYNAICLSISMGGMNYPMPLMFEEAEGMGIVVDYENNMIDLYPLLEMLSMYYPGNTSVCMLSVGENYETFVFGDTLVSFSGIFGGMPAVFDFESAGEHELEVLLKDEESLDGMFTNNSEVNYGLVEVVIPDTVKYLHEYCFAYDNNLFKVTIPESVESVGSYCFAYCSSLTDVSFLGENVKSICSYAFNYCENLTTITLPDSIETLEYGAFRDCCQLNSVKLPNGISALNSQTFYGCLVLDNVVIPDSVTVIDETCFYDCWGLKNITLSKSLNKIGYLSFKNCSGITSITLPESLTSIDSYAFDSCVNLKEIYALPSTAPSIDNISFYRVPETGVLYYPYGSDYNSWKRGSLLNWEFVADFTATLCTSLTITANNVKWNETTTTIQYTATVNGVNCLGNTITGVVITGTTVSEVFEENQSDKTFERVVTFEFMGVTATTNISQSGNLKHLGFTAINNCQFTFTKNGDGDDIRYSTDYGVTWTALPNGESTPQIKSGETIFWVSSITPSDEGIGYFSSTSKFKAHGNVMSLLYGDNFKEETSLEGKDYVFKNLFNNCSYLIDASTLILPATTLATRCYDSMFYNCVNLTTAPELPATTLAEYCYLYMFQRCWSLTTAPELPATTLAEKCYCNMFTDCKSLTTSPELPATTLANDCYYSMFAGCSGLTTAPELPATTLADGCYLYMFKDCTNLTTAPELPSTTLAERCYWYMFDNCTSLNRITMLATDISASNCLNGWVNGVASTGTFVKHPDMDSLPTGIHGIPEGWTVEDYQG